jgi:ABC-type transporter Mla subunit MlaD
MYRKIILAAVIAAILLVYILLTNGFRKIADAINNYPMFAVTTEAPGVDIGAPVMMSGVRIGLVKDIQARGHQIVFVLEIGRRHRIPAGSEARVQPGGITGARKITILPSQTAGFLDARDTLQLTGGRDAEGIDALKGIGEGIAGLGRFINRPSVIEAKLDTVIMLLRHREDLLMQNRSIRSEKAFEH